MFKLLSINGVDFPDPEGGLSITRIDKYNAYESEDGHTTIESIREGMIDVSVSIKVQEVAQLRVLSAALSLVSTVNIFDPGENREKTITAKITDVKMDKVAHKSSASLWSLSFNISEL